MGVRNVLSVMLLLLSNSIAFGATQAKDCDKGFFWSGRRCVHQYYKSCIRAEKYDHPSTDDISLYKQFSRQHRTNDCFLLERSLVKGTMLGLDCSKISDLSSVAHLPNLDHVYLRNIHLLESLDFLQGSKIQILVLRSYHKTTDLSAISQLDNLLALTFIDGGKVPFLEDIPKNVYSFGIINSKNGRDLYDSLRKNRNNIEIQFRDGEEWAYHERKDDI